MRLEIVGPVYWRPIVTESLELVRTSGGLGFAFLRALHSRQCGVPPGLCVSFAEFVKGNSTGAWSDIQRELDWHPVLGGKELNECPPYELMRILFAPIMFAAQRQIAVNVVFAGDGYPDQVSESTFSYADHARQFAERAREIAARHMAESHLLGPRTQGFVAVASRQILRRAISRTDESGLDLYFSADVALPAMPQSAVRGADAPYATTRGGRKPQQGGVAGVRKDHSIDALSCLVPGQLVGPPVLVAQQLFEEGVLVFDRPPPTDEPGEVLLLALVPDAIESPALSTVRAAWWLFAWQAVGLLKRRRYENVRVIWLQGVHGEPRPAELDTQDRPGDMRSLLADRGQLLAAMKRDPGHIEPFARGRAALDAEVPPTPAQVAAALQPLLGRAATGEILLGAHSESVELALFDRVFAITIVGLDHSGSDDPGDIRHVLDRVSPVLADGPLVRVGAAPGGARGLTVDGGETYPLDGDEDSGAREVAAQLAGLLLGECLHWVSKQEAA